jgi:hypothetical protein
MSADYPSADREHADVRTLVSCTLWLLWQCIPSAAVPPARNPASIDFWLRCHTAASSSCTKITATTCWLEPAILHITLPWKSAPPVSTAKASTGF